HKTGVEQLVEVSAKEEAVVGVVGAFLAERTDVRCLQNGQRVFAGDRAGALVGVGHDRAEGSLTAPGAYEPGLTVSARHLGFTHDTLGPTLQPKLYLTPDVLARLAISGIVGPSGHNVLREQSVDWNPLL